MRVIIAILSWVIWPSLFFAGYWLANVILMTGRRCSIEGCDPPENGLLLVLFLIAMFGPPAYLTSRMIRERRTR
ncbi:MAG TPA: hypothetical protein VFH40_00365 [Gemmatimonadales bacterium]|nr:hypothetical protein [Gemmatimonadales bacterium]